jgi:hypothetical protein
LTNRTAIVYTCAHADPGVSNVRFSWLGNLIEDIKPDYVVDLGDGADMRSLNTYDTRYPAAIVAQSYQADIDCYNDSQSRIWDKGSRYGISFAHLQTDHWFDEYHEYKNSAPALAEYDGVLYGHYVASGNFGSALSTKHHGYSLVEKLACSVTVGHSHKFHHYIKADARPTPMHGLVAGCFKGKEESWAGQANSEWTKNGTLRMDLMIYNG